MRRKALRVLVVAAVAGGILFLFVLPGRTWMAQSRAISRAERIHSLLSQENAALSQKVAELQSPAYIERVAREQYGLVMPGETAYAILPPAATTTTTVPAQGKGSRRHS